MATLERENVCILHPVNYILSALHRTITLFLSVGSGALRSWAEHATNSLHLPLHRLWVFEPKTASTLTLFDFTLTLPGTVKN